MDVEREVDRLDARVIRLEDLELRSFKDDTRADLDEIKQMLLEDRKQREVDRRESLKEKKSDRRWQFGASLTAASLVVGAAALLLQAFGGGP